MSPRSIRWGLLSTARINERLIPVIRDSSRCELLAVASGSGQEKAARYAAQWYIPRAYGSYEALLADRQQSAVAGEQIPHLRQGEGVEKFREQALTGALGPPRGGNGRPLLCDLCALCGK